MAIRMHASLKISNLFVNGDSNGLTLSKYPKDKREVYKRINTYANA